MYVFYYYKIFFSFTDIEINQELFPSIAGPSTSGLNEYQPPQPSRAQTPLDAESEGALAGVRASNSHLDNTLAELEALRAQITERPRWNGRFHSLHKRRRRRLVTRALLSDEALLDDLFICQVQVNVRRQFSGQLKHR